MTWKARKAMPIRQHHDLKSQNKLGPGREELLGYVSSKQSRYQYL